MDKPMLSLVESKNCGLTVRKPLAPEITSWRLSKELHPLKNFTSKDRIKFSTNNQKLIKIGTET